MKDGFVGQFDVLEEPTGRRSWPDEVKARIVMESFAPGARVGAVARRHRVLPSQLTTWRRQAREGRIALPVDAPGLPTPAEFVPLVVDAPDPTPSSDRGRDRIEIETGGMVIRLPGTIPARRLAEIVGALRSTRA
ncbi:transposase [Rhodovulum tesquicola]|uniref:Transposase n=1 Tax=Rhodovulum strictum TaxID=58314 RepID=A0A844BMM3_9RHOB|nr:MULTISPECIES: transposase [Rhodovulum]MCO8145855.1 transposase [Rhodovulum tesquicola]MRH22193.1 transposase [Rhodovulum strictum]